MRRAEKEITNRREIDSILSKAIVCRISIIDHETPYIVPMNFGYKDDILYLHSAPEGKKIDLLKRNPRVCFEVESDLEIINTGIPCKWSMNYTSVIGYGKAKFITDIEQKQKALHIIIDHYTPGSSYIFPEKNLKEVTVIKIEINQMTGKKSGN
ncbi:MAG TPA: pyridoxamine 5'-phosphate oxidase family protein [Candidatus Thermoplasmatota archaeon]|nr:pyridoxamine 5'-phosphate oxidase family protein [Candidatus Thermoplasmatota archaeon]